MSRLHDIVRWLFTLLIVLFPLARAENVRKILSLDGTWQLAEGSLDAIPKAFDHQVVVPGLVSMAKPAFEEVGVKSGRREAFWYRRKFNFDGKVPPVALLKVHKAMFGAQVMLNGKSLGEHQPCFTPGYFDAKAALREGDNELIIRVGAFTDSLPKEVPTGWDNEKKKYIPGIYDSVELILSGNPFIARVQAIPDIEKQAVTIHAWLKRAGAPPAAKVRFVVREVASGRIAGKGECEIREGADESEPTGQVTISLSGCRLWSPEDPFLYEIEAHSTEDSITARFGMRSFNFDKSTGRAVLNGKPYFLRGSNISLYRFFEDSECGDKPWREEWVRRLHKKVRGMHWNSLRYCIGFPPEFWYRIADEEGILIQDEFPIWDMDPKPEKFDPNQLALEYTEWMQERWNHPSVVIWDACNETHVQARTGDAIKMVRGLDFSKRPWDNGWAPPESPGDVFESHPYHFSNAKYKLADIAKDSGIPDGNVGIDNNEKNPIIINEYGWLWLNRDGTPTTLTRDLYNNLLGPDSTTAERQHLYARYTAAETEFWRSHRACAGILDFCVLGYSRADGQTSDHWSDVEKLSWEPNFYQHVRDSFAPVGLMIDAWAEEYAAGKAQEFPVVVINDLDKDWQGTIRCRLLHEGVAISEKIQDGKVGSPGKTNICFTFNLPKKPGKYQVEAALLQSDNDPVRSLRDFKLKVKSESSPSMSSIDDP